MTREDLRAIIYGSCAIVIIILFTIVNIATRLQNEEKKLIKEQTTIYETKIEKEKDKQNYLNMEKISEQTKQGIIKREYNKSKGITSNE